MIDEPLAPGVKLAPASEPPLVAIPPVTVTVVGGQERGVPIPSGTVFTTPDHQPNVIYRVITPLVAISVRFASTFATSLLGFMTLQMMPTGGSPVMIAIHGLDFYHLVLTGAGIAFAPAGYDLLRNLVTILGKLEQKYPLMTGSI